MDTPFFYEQETKESVEYLKAASFNGELTKIEDIAPIVEFLATDGWYINGQTILANDAFTTKVVERRLNLGGVLTTFECLVVVI